jgi:hypothetical protein
MSDGDVQARLAALEARIKELEDDRAIREVLARYGYNADGCRDEAYIALYTDDGVMNLTVGPGTPHYKGVMVWKGKDELRQFITDPGAHHRPGFYGHSMHVQGNNIVTHIDGDQAVVNSYSIVLHDDDGNLRLQSAGNNQWQLKKVDGQWLIQERRRRQVGDGHYTGNLDATPE